MARKPQEPLYHSAELSAEQIRRAIPRLEKRIADLHAMDFSQMRERGGPEIQAIKVAIEQTLEEIFGRHSTEYQRYAPSANLSGGSVGPLYVGMGRPPQDFGFRAHYDKSRLASIAMLQQAIRGLGKRLEELTANNADMAGDESTFQLDRRDFSQKVFVVHGRSIRRPHGRAI